MKLNENQAILTRHILLVPYSEHHVPTYHEWMQDEELRKATASEPLTLLEEYAMQRSWRTDADKLTFIICLAPDDAIKRSTSKLEAGRLDSPRTMIGDVNLFLYPCEDDDEDTSQARENSSKQALHKVIGEIEIMIARKTHQGNGLGSAALLTFIWYIVANLEDLMAEYHGSHEGPKVGSCLEYLRVKIDGENARSIRLFEGVGFTKVSEEPNYFGELELRRSISAPYRGELKEELGTAPIVIAYA